MGSEIMERTRESTYGLIALAISGAEAALIAGGLVVVCVVGLWGRAPLWVERAFRVVYIAGLAGPAFAVMALIKGSGRAYAALALLLAVLCLGLGGFLFGV